MNALFYFTISLLIVLPRTFATAIRNETQIIEDKWYNTSDPLISPRASSSGQRFHLHICNGHLDKRANPPQCTRDCNGPIEGVALSDVAFWAGATVCIQTDCSFDFAVCKKVGQKCVRSTEMSHRMVKIKNAKWETPGTEGCLYDLKKQITFINIPPKRY